MTSHNKKKIKKKMTKDSSSFSCIFEDNCMNISFRNCLPQKLIFLTETRFWVPTVSGPIVRTELPFLFDGGLYQ